MGSLQTPAASGLSAAIEGQGSSGERTPTPAGLLERREAQDEAVRQKIRALGDEVGGLDSDEEEEALVQAQIEAEEEEAAREQERSRRRRDEAQGEVNERTSLLGGRKLASTNSFADLQVVGAAKKRFGGWVDKARTKAKGVSVTREDLIDGGKVAVQSIPAVVLGVLMNILDGVSYGMIMFPTNLPVFADFGGIGVSMFFASCVVSQLVYSGGGSIFSGGNGSMMIEVVPFFHVIVGIITSSISDDKSVVATTMVAFALSSILTGLAFGLLGWLKLGSLSEFFPRHILVGCIGGVGAFLFVTGLQVSARLEEEAGFSMDLVKHYFDWSVLPLWTVPLILAVVLRLITARFHHPLIFPGYFLAIPLVFYGIAFAAGFNIEQLREGGWVFEVNGVDSEWYEYWTLFDFKKTDYSALLETIPTQLALVFFGLLHVPINVPALGISVGEDNVNTDRELIAHGISNIAAGLLGTVPNYLCYVNSVLFYKVGGTTRISGFLLAAASFGILVAGPGIISLLPVCIVGALIFILAIDLIKEAIWDTYGRVARFEYVTIWAIVIVMTGWDFVAGIGVGIILACVSFVVSSSQRRAIRSILTGAVARSTVRRHPKQSAFLKEVGRQTRVIKLQGFLFFGTISACETTIRKILEAASWSKNPIRFLVLDFSMASGVDFSAAEAFVRIQRLLEDKGVVLVLCGCPANSNVGIALRSVDLWADGAEAKVEVFENLNDALEHCENAFLRSLYSKDYQPPRLLGPAAPAISSQIGKLPLLASVAEAPEAPAFKTNFQQPLPLLMQSFKPFAPDLNEDYCFRLVPYFKRVHIERGTTLWKDGDETDSFYLIESGMLRATYVFTDRAHSIVESMVAGTVAGEMSFLSRSKRNATVVAERDSVLWKMSIESHEELGKREGWSFARKFEQCLLSIAIEEQDGELSPDRFSL
ncbi:sulfate transporter family-domain-containing protein [Leucosporidium creatinivorum]|uniref:Sulfate transporter family-domain-containing protein n=1 Tax=Leucosporidium creatinivorum TaxID=106004 RepID=A0A1Y2EVW9_9BASI|nr:sulfate transporter family-domain-containing protein [Leucosporidium creatinivorum]